MSLIKLDYDHITTRDVGLIFLHRGFLIKFLGIKELESFETERGYHVRIKIITKLSDADVQMVQMLMGSDIHREIYNFLRRLDGQLIEKWNKLYSKKHLVLKTKIKEELSSEEHCQILQDKIMEAIKDSKDVSGFI